MGIGSSQNSNKSPVTPNREPTLIPTQDSKPLTRIFRDEAYWAIPRSCSKILNSKGITIGSMMGQGYWSTVYNACSFDESEPCSKIVKLIPLYPIPHRSDVQNAEYYLYGRILAPQYVDKFLFSEQLARYDRRRDLKLQRDQVDKQFEQDNPQLFQNYIPLTRKERKLSFDQEVELSKFTAQLEISPSISDAFVCDDVLRVPEYGALLSLGFIVMDRWDITLEDYYQDEGNENLTVDLYNKLVEKVKLLHENGIAHNDLHDGNIILKLDSAHVPVDVAIIDFGNAVLKRDGETQFWNTVDFDLDDLDRLKPKKQ